MIRILSVPHTGTRFLVDVLQRAGLTKTHALWGNGDFIQAHFGSDHPMVTHRNGTVLIPLRRREEVAASWYRRGSSIPELERRWTQMCEFISGYNDAFLLHIDDPLRRDNELEAISERIGTPLTADFSVKVGHRPG